MKLSCLKTANWDEQLPATVKSDPATVETEFSRKEYFELIVDK